MSRFRLTIVAVFLAATPCLSQNTPRVSRIVLAVPFENTSKAPGIEWIGEAFSEVLGSRMAAANMFVIRREDRVYAFDRLGIPVNVRPSRATLYRMAEEMDVDYILLGSFNFDGRTFAARSQVLDVKRVRLSPESVETGGLAQLVEIQNAIAWDLLHDIDPNTLPAKSSYLAAQSAIRLDALENYVRGNLATDTAAKIKYYKEALRVSPDYSQATLQLGHTYFDEKEYQLAAQYFARVPKTEPAASESNFFLGMSYYYTGNFDKAESAFAFVAARVPLIEVYNNLGVVAARQGKKDSDGYFERVVQADSRDPDYRFNLAVNLARNGDSTGALKQIKEALAVAPQDSEAKALLDGLSRGMTSKLPLERIKTNYDETQYRQLAMEIQNVNEQRHASMTPSEHSAAHVQRGRELLQQGLLDQSESEFREAILVDQSSADAHAGLAYVLEERDELTGARAEASAANRIKFTAEAFLALARIDMKLNKLESARDNTDRALKLEPDNPPALQLKKDIALQLAQRPQSTQKN